ncbi:MAG: competence/damage-inducible protein A [Alphaproteobacteria bacterium]|nr:competence/damage-inducible protein A [Alphaproteobacteria bacterium]
MTDSRVYTASVLIIGNEILSGRTRDENLQFLAEQLNLLGIRFVEARIVRDDEPAIVAAVNELRGLYDYVLTTGGIGPTHDDITSECIAKAFGRKLTRHPEALRLLESHFRPSDLNEARLRMASMPEGAALIDNRISLVPGFQIENVFVLAGVPSVMRAMFEGAKGRLRGGQPQQSRAVMCRLTEGVLARELGEIQQYFADIEIGSYPFFRRGEFGTSLVLRGTDISRLELATEKVRRMVRALGGDPRDETNDKGAEVPK